MCQSDASGGSRSVQESRGVGARVSVLDVRDIAAVAAIALTESGHEGATYTLTGPASITHGEIAAALTSALGRDITFIDVRARRLRRQPAGHPAALADPGPPGDYSHYRRGEAASVSPAIAEITGKPATDVRQLARDHVRIFVG